MQLKERDEKIALLEQENALLRQKVDLLIKRIFGSSSEKLDLKQLELLLGQGESGKECASSEKEEAVVSLALLEAPERRKPHRERAQRVPENLPCIDEIIEPQEVEEAPQEWRRIGQEISEQLDYEPARFFRRRIIRPTYVRRKELDLSPITAPLPPTLQERCTAAPGLLAQIVVAKYCDHLPLYRQEYIYWSRHGVWLPRQSMARYVDLVAFWVTPIYQQICVEVTAGGYVQLDETPVRYLEPGNGKAKQGYLWVCNRPKVGVEVLSLELGDIRWRTGELLIRGKGGRQDFLPLPHDVGAAIARYLRLDRGIRPTQRVFLRTYAPRVPLSGPASIGHIVRQALVQADVERPMHIAAHLFRHTLASRMLQQGANLRDISEALRHRAASTTEIYAKIDIGSLNEVVRPWPAQGVAK